MGCAGRASQLFASMLRGLGFLDSAVEVAILIDLTGDSALEIQSECFNDLQYVYDMCMIHIHID